MVVIKGGFATEGSKVGCLEYKERGYEGVRLDGNFREKSVAEQRGFLHYQSTSGLVWKYFPIRCFVAGGNYDITCKLDPGNQAHSSSVARHQAIDEKR